VAGCPAGDPGHEQNAHLGPAPVSAPAAGDELQVYRDVLPGCRLACRLMPLDWTRVVATGTFDCSCSRVARQDAYAQYFDSCASSLLMAMLCTPDMSFLFGQFLVVGRRWSD
jgi:hypothetical protein